MGNKTEYKEHVKNHADQDYSDWVGSQVVKFSGKPFKSGAKIATVKSLTTNPHTEAPAFLFEEDDSYVSCKMCVII